MNRLSRYLAVLFVQRLLIAGFAMVILLGVLDALGNADLLPQNAGLLDTFRFMALRMPILFDRILMFAFLMALLLTYTALIRRNELVAISGAGISVFGQVRALIPAVVLASVASAVFIDQVNPWTTRKLEDWLGADVLRDDSGAPSTLWLAEDGWLIEIAGMEGETLKGVTLFERVKGGRIASVSLAESAARGPEGWNLTGVTQQRFDGKAIALPKVWHSLQTPETLRLLRAEPRDLSLASLMRLAGMTHSGNQPKQAYLVWAVNRVSLPLVAIGFMMIAVALMQRFGRGDSGILAMALGMGGGFVFMVADGVFKSLAESGNMSAYLAVGIPIAVLMVSGFALLLRRWVAG